jgi:hypothetical protein
VREEVCPGRKKQKLGLIYLEKRLDHLVEIAQNILNFCKAEGIFLDKSTKFFSQ